MDRSDETKEVSFRSLGTTDLDRVLDDDSEGSTVKIPADGQMGNEPVGTTEPKLERNQENMNALLLFLMDEIRTLKIRMDPKSENHSEISDEDDNVSINSKIEEYIPIDQER